MVTLRPHPLRGIYGRIPRAGAVAGPSVPARDAKAARTVAHGSLASPAADAVVLLLALSCQLSENRLGPARSLRAACITEPRQPGGMSPGIAVPAAVNLGEPAGNLPIGVQDPSRARSARAPLLMAWTRTITVAGNSAMPEAHSSRTPSVLKAPRRGAVTSSWPCQMAWQSIRPAFSSQQDKTDRDAMHGAGP
jgi:hypothetical protein